MKRHTWSLHHKWLGLILAFFICMFCLSGLVLNHQEWTGTIDVSRRLLPDDYRLSNWNKGLFKGTQKWQIWVSQKFSWIKPNEVTKLIE